MSFDRICNCKCYESALCMLVTGEVLEMLTHEGVELAELEDAAFSSV